MTLAVLNSAPDPFQTNQPEIYDTFPIYKDVSGRTQVDPRLVGGQNTVLLLVHGVSMIANWTQETYTATQTNNHQLVHYNGGVYRAANPYLGATYDASITTPASYMTRLGDKLIADAYCARVVIANVSAGGALVWDWAPGGTLNERLVVSAKRASALYPSGLYKTFIIQHQGGIEDTLTATQYANYAVNAINSVRSNGFPNTKAIIIKGTWIDGVLNAPVRGGQDITAASTNNVLGPDFDTLIDGTGRWDNTHFNGTGSLAASNALAAIIEAN